jgi:hypothetical protein
MYGYSVLRIYKKKKKKKRKKRKKKKKETSPNVIEKNPIFFFLTVTH